MLVYIFIFFNDPTHFYYYSALPCKLIWKRIFLFIVVKGISWSHLNWQQRSWKLQKAPFASANKIQFVYTYIYFCFHGLFSYFIIIKISCKWIWKKKKVCSRTKRYIISHKLVNKGCKNTEMHLFPHLKRKVGNHMISILFIIIKISHLNV